MQENTNGPRRLYRSNTNKVLAGVCGGLGEYANVDPVIFRLIWVVATIFTGIVPGVLTYLLTIFIMPARPQAAQAHTSEPIKETPSAAASSTDTSTSFDHDRKD